MTSDHLPRNAISPKAEMTACGLNVARPTGLEPATTGSTVRYSNQLSYGPNI
jgi:hypothetical protein